MPQVRKFGTQPCVLDLDFGSRQRVELVTQILGCCACGAAGEPVEPELLLDLPVGKRIELLVRLAAELPGSFPAADGAGGALEISLTCQNPVCNQPMDLELDLAELETMQEQAEDTAGFIHIQAGEAQVTLRRPTGRDQLLWQQQAAAGQAGLDFILRSLLVEPPELWKDRPIPGDFQRAADAALQELDPLVNYQVAAACPFCGAEYSYPVDLQELALGRLKEAQRRLLDEIHTLASSYHWSEPQIMALPAWRRERYLARVEGALDHSPRERMMR